MHSRSMSHPCVESWRMSETAVVNASPLIYLAR